ncbi:hypothetical protein QJS66_23215 [Kocuria rhizophila]|nr:hypothetical protein QJS66_23215 [Kocuria rhizophila]
MLLGPSGEMARPGDPAARRRALLRGAHPVVRSGPGRAPRGSTWPCWGLNRYRQDEPARRCCWGCCRSPPGRRASTARVRGAAASRVGDVPQQRGFPERTRCGRATSWPRAWTDTGGDALALAAGAPQGGRAAQRAGATDYCASPAGRSPGRAAAAADRPGAPRGEAHGHAVRRGAGSPWTCATSTWSAKLVHEQRERTGCAVGVVTDDVTRSSSTWTGSGPGQRLFRIGTPDEVLRSSACLTELTVAPIEALARQRPDPGGR